jgi:chemotaxis signal transduction protein
VETATDTALDSAQVSALDSGAQDDSLAAAGYVIVRLGDAPCAIRMDSVAEVGRLPAVTRIPGTPAWVAGAANWRGRILAVVDIRTLLGAAPSTTGTLGRLVVLTDGHVTVGLLTEGVQGILTGVDDRMEEVPSTIDARARGLLVGQVTEPTGPIAVLDPAAILDLRHALASVGH